LYPALLPVRVYTFLFVLLGLAYIPGLFVPLMDNDSAHHANIALQMHLTGDYITLRDHNGDYLDKPHLLFWLCALSYKVFGITTFAYKIPSFLFTILGTWSTYRLGKALYNKETGRLAALIVASSFAYILANNDVRMDAILTASIVFAIWQLVEFIHSEKLLFAAGSALGLALAFSTKGNIGIVVPASAALFYIMYRKQWPILLNPKSLLIIFLFVLLISPVVYAYYVQFNLHPEKIVRNHDNIDGVKFILWEQPFERLDGKSFGTHGSRDSLFFFHTFLWAFCPWAVLAYISLVLRLKHLFQRRLEWLTPGAFLVVIIGVSVSGFKLPHYLNIVLPVTAIMVASFLHSQSINLKWTNAIFYIQLITICLMFVPLVILNAWAFPITNSWVLFVILSLIILFGLFINSGFTRLQKTVIGSVAAMIVSFFTLNTNFYWQLLQYQGGNQLAFQVRREINPANIYLWKGFTTQSWSFYTHSG
jgi:4-amino-4-deoxy-L-arabinose transferase-like glycosyltransferase